MFLHSSPSRHVISALLIGTMLSGCSVAPKYTTPDMAIPAQYKQASEQEIQGVWRKATANPGQADISTWWHVFNDDRLNALQEQAAKANQDLKIAAARLDQARALIGQARAAQLPDITTGTSVSRGNLFGNTNAGKPTTNYNASGTVSYDPDLFGRLRDATQAVRFDAKAQEALYRQALLTIHGDVAQSYFMLQALDTERNLLSQTIVLRDKAQNLLQQRFKEGEVNEQDYFRATAEAATTRAELAALDQQRAVTEHALAVLLGDAPTDFALENAELPRQLPIIPAGLPAHLLERRPDIAAAQNSLKAANARIGVARAAFFPGISLSAAGGFASNELGDLFKWSSRSWLLGPIFGNLISVPIFDGGLRKAQLAVSKAQYQEAVATYRQQVLVAFKDVDDNLATLRLQAEQADHLYQAAEAASRASHLSDIRYEEGETSYLEVLDTQRDTLAAQRAYTRAQGNRFMTTVALIRSLGGGWVETDHTDTPTEEIPQEDVADAPKMAKNITPDDTLSDDEALRTALQDETNTEVSDVENTPAETAPAPAQQPAQQSETNTPAPSDTTPIEWNMRAIKPNRASLPRAQSASRVDEMNP